MEFQAAGYYNTQFTPEKRVPDTKNGENFVIEDLLDIPNDENMVLVEGAPDATAFMGTSPDSSNMTAVADGSCNSSFSPADPHYRHGPEMGAPSNFSSELCVPYEDVAELEWLSNFAVEESFSSDDLQKLELIQGMKARNTEASEIHHYQFQPETARPGPVFRPEMAVPGKARSKRSRAAPGNWTSRLLVVSPTPSVNNVSSASSVSESDITLVKKPMKPGPMKKKEGPENSASGDGRKCLHCATDKTPQWRTGPMGPKTLCNACGVRYKSGRLVPEYRPASSPTFVLTKHSNSHRKVLELRRQKEMQRAQQQQQFLHHHHQNMMFGHVASNADDYLIHQHIGPDYRQLI